MKIKYMKRIPSLLLTGVLLTVSPQPSVAETLPEEQAITESQELTEKPGIMESQSDIERQLLEWYEQSDAKTLETAQVHQDLYGTAPLTAVILFETDTPEKVTVTVHGKDPGGDITYVTEADTWHEVSIFGLYADWNNQVTLETSSGQKREFEIVTEPLPDTMTQVAKASGDGTQLGNQLFYLCDKYRTIFDQNGDIRWYMAGLSTAFNGIDEVDPRNHSFWFSTEGSSRSMATVYCMSFTGKVLGKFFTLGKSAHHDATLLPDGRLLYYSKWGTISSELSILDPTDGSVSLYYDPQELFDEDLGSLEYATKDHPWDYAHANTVEYVEENDSLLLSFRNQHVIMNMDFSTKKINWVLTPAYTTDSSGNAQAIQEQLTDYLILPAEDDSDFQWFYSQHAPTLISYDEEQEIYDIVLLDNGTDRMLSVDADGAEKDSPHYSRLVRYQVDARNRTVSQIYQYGQDHPEYYSDQCGNAQYLAETDHYIANFPGLEKQDTRLSIVTESDSEGKEIAEYQITNTPDGTYRAYSYDASVFAPSQNIIGDSQKIEYVENYDLQGVKWKESNYNLSIGTETYGINEISLTEKGLAIRGAIQGKEERTKNHTFRLVAVNENGEQYSFSLVRFLKFRFYMPGIPMDQLPEGAYRLGIYAESDGEILGYKEIPWTYTSSTGTPSADTSPTNAALADTSSTDTAPADTSSTDTASADADGKDVSQAPSGEDIINTTIWDVNILAAEASDQLETTVPVTQYDGSVDQVQYSNTPADGQIYILLNLDISKTGKGTGSFSWDNVFLQDQKENRYNRINDSFLSDHGYDRMAGTDIKIGSKNGWICFEIPAESAKDTLTLLFRDEEGEIQIPFRIQTQ